MPDLSNAHEAWYCFQALTKREHIAASLLRAELGIPVFCPRIAYDKSTRRGKVRFIDPLFPGYLFLRTDLREYYRAVMATQGIRRLVSYGERVPQVPEPFIHELRERIGENEIREVEAPKLQEGTEVKVTRGPFMNMDAVVAGVVPARERVRLLLELLGREVSVEVSAFDVYAESGKPPVQQVWKEG